MTIINDIDLKIEQLIDAGTNKEAFAFVQDVINHCVLSLSGLHTYKGDNAAAYEVLHAGLSFATNYNISNNMAAMLLASNEYSRALEVIEYTVKSFPGNSDVYYNYGLILKALGRLEDAVEAIDKAIALNTNERLMGPAHCMVGGICAALGQFSRSFTESWYRFTYGHLKGLAEHYGKPIWDATDLTGKTILVINEQGKGDLIQFSRYARLLKDRAHARVVLEVPNDMVYLFESLEGIDKVVTKLDRGEFDCIVPAMSLPYFFDENLENIPLQDRYLKSNKGFFSWSTDSKKKKIGICWAGSNVHNNDHNRSCLLKYFKPLFDLAGRGGNISLFGLQAGPNARVWPGGDTDLLEGTEFLSEDGLDYTDLVNHLTDFNNTAVIIENLDLVISVDTSVAHLAGALDIPCYLLIPHAFEWRWQKKWYPKMKSFRQEKQGDWENLLIQVAKEI